MEITRARTTFIFDLKGASSSIFSLLLVNRFYKLFLDKCSLCNRFCYCDWWWMHVLYKWASKAYKAVDSTETSTEEGFVTKDMMEGMEAFFSDFLFIVCSNVLLTGRHGLSSFLLRERCIFSWTHSLLRLYFTEAIELMEDIHPSIHPFLSHLSLSGLRCQQCEQSNPLFFFPATGSSLGIPKCSQDRWDM